MPVPEVVVDGYAFPVARGIEPESLARLFRNARTLTEREWRVLRQEYFERGRAERGPEFCKSDLVNPLDAPYGFFPVRNALLPKKVVMVRKDFKEMFLVTYD
jgi:hypothetical protein